MGMQLPGKGNKYRNVRTKVGDISFASKKEARRYGELLILQRAGAISGLVTQPRYPLTVNGELICTYVGDYSYLENGKLVVEDVKSAITKKNPVYRIKRAMMKAIHSIDILET